MNTTINRFAPSGAAELDTGNASAAHLASRADISPRADMSPRADISPRADMSPRALCALLALVAACWGTSVHAQQQAADAPAAAVEIAAVDINSADAEQLAQGLNGVGLRRAEAIVRYREQFGPFESVEELSEVQGIGEATVARNRERIRLR